MKSFFLMLMTIGITSLQAQNLVAKYTFSSYDDTVVFDGSGNGYHGILHGDAYITGNDANPGVLIVGNKLSDYFTVPPEVLHGLDDFAIRIKLRIRGFHTEGVDPMNTIFSTSNPGCIYCFGLAYRAPNDAWELTMHDSTYSFTDALSKSGIEIIIKRESGIVSFYSHGDLLGSFDDDQLLDVSSFVFAQREHCPGGCFKKNQGLRGGLNNIQVMDGNSFQRFDEETDVSFSTYPNPFSSITNISFALEENSHTSIELFDLSGRKLLILLDENLDEGNHEVRLNRQQLSSGIYFLQLKTNSSVMLSRVVIE